MNTKGSPALNLSISRQTRDIEDRVVSLRRQIHSCPELAHQESQTQKLVMETLAGGGIDCRPLADTGVVGLIEGRRGPGKVLLLRADMDALPIQEDSSAAYKSRNDGVMHACGHDAHTAMLLGAALNLAAEPDFSGTVKLMFQPAEEGAGGAEKMVRAGILESPSVDASLALHVWSTFEIGQVVVSDGPMTASVDSFEIQVHGRGVHAATPEDGVDPIVIAAQIITAAQTIVSRRKGPFEQAVLSFTQVQGGSTFNVIPPSVLLRGTIRALDESTREMVKNGLGEMATAIAASMGGAAELRFLDGTGVTVNDAEVVREVRAVAGEIVGEDRLIASRPMMIGEDIGLVQQRVPGALVLLGCGNKGAGIDYPHHHPKFDIDERVLGVGVELLTRFARDFLIQELRGRQSEP